MAKGRKATRIFTYVALAALVVIGLHSKRQETTKDANASLVLSGKRNDIQASFYDCLKPPNAKSHVVCKKLPYAKPTCQSVDEDAEKCPGCLVPNIVHYVWFGNRTLLFYQYLSVLSVATNQKPTKIMFHADVAPQGQLWSKLVAEVPCLQLSYLEAPNFVFGNRVSPVMHKTDVARTEILLKYGGIYLDSDVIVLKSLNPLRRNSYIMGRSTKDKLSNGAFLSEPNAPFLKENFKAYENYGKKKVEFAYYSCDLPYKMWKTRPDLPIHVEETSIHRPNPYVDGVSCMTHDSFDIGDNYMLHLHPIKSMKAHPEVKKHGVEELRIADTTYGAAARAALFGTQDLVFLEGEEGIARDRKTPKAVRTFLQ